MHSQSPPLSQQTAIFLIRSLAGDGSARARALRLIISAGGDRTAVTPLARLACIAIIRGIDIQPHECEYISGSEQRLISLIAQFQHGAAFCNGSADAILLEAVGDAADTLSRLGISLQ